MSSVSCEIAGPLWRLLPQDFHLDMLCACFAQKSLVVYVCVCVRVRVNMQMKKEGSQWRAGWD